MIYKDINILDRNLNPLDSIGVGGEWGKTLLRKIIKWAKNYNTKIVSVVRLTYPGEAFDLGTDDIIKIGNLKNEAISFGIWKVYGNPEILLKSNPRGQHRYLDWKNATEELVKKQKKNIGAITTTLEAQEWGLRKHNPRKEMKIGTPDKKISLFKIMEEIDETSNEYRFRMQPPSKFHETSLKYGKKSITKGVRAIYGCPKSEWAPRLEKCKKGLSMQSLRLSKDVFHSKTEAARWISRHTKPRRE